MDSKNDRSGDGNILPIKPKNRTIPDLLKAYYHSIESEEIPDTFLDLLERLDAAEAAAGSAGKVDP